jgi:ankyrin repeat protein
MMHAEWIKYLKRENKAKNFDQNYYMPRKLKRSIQIDRKLLEKKANDIIFVHTEEEFNEKCRKNPEMKDIHYLIQNNNNRNHLLWKKSNGPISPLNIFIIKNEECEEKIDEEEIFHKNNDKVLIISAEPGMGKSLILDNFTLNSSAENFFVKIILNTCSKTLSDLKNQKIKLQNIKDLIDFVMKFLLRKTNEQEIGRLKHLAQKEKLILMFDGLDEVNDYKEQVIQLIDALSRDDEKYKINKILITTRNHLKQQLEDHFKTFAFNLNNFSEDDQKNFLFKYWRNLNNNLDEGQLKAAAKKLIRQVKSSLTEKISELIGIPLQTKMLADIYFEQINENEKTYSKVKITNIADLYNEFVESKIRIQLEEKCKRDMTREKSQKLEREKKMFYSDHVKLSSSILFEIKKENKLNLELGEEEILEYGIVVEFTPNNKTPRFLHQSFAEFFLAKSCFIKIDQNKDNDKELEQILKDERHFLIRKFLNDLMEKHQETQPIQQQKEKKTKNCLSSLIDKLKKNDPKKQVEIANCCRENLIFILKYFIQCDETILKTKNQILTIASHYGSEVIVNYLLEKGIDVNQQDEDGCTALYWASYSGYKEIVQILSGHKDINVNKQDKVGSTALEWASKNGYKEILQLLLEHKDINVNLKDGEGRTALFWAFKKKRHEIVKMLLVHKDINVNQQDKKGETALIVASREGKEEIVQLLLEHKEIDVNQQDKNGDTALIVATYCGRKEIVQLLLAQKEVNVNRQNNEGETALVRAYRDKAEKIFQLLLEHKEIDVNQQNKEGETTLHLASIQGRKEIVQFLLENKDIDVNQQEKWTGTTALILATQRRHKEIVQLLLEHKDIDVNLQDNEGQTALYWASNEGNKEIVQLLLEHKDININQLSKEGRTSLYRASWYGHHEMVQLLLKQKYIDVNQQDEDGRTALMEASYYGRKEIVQLLLEHNDINVNQQDKYGETALTVAFGYGHKEIVQLLLDQKDIDVNHRDHNGQTALWWAYDNGHKEIFYFLLEHKDIDVNQQNKSGKTALMFATYNGDKKMVKLFLDQNRINVNQQDKWSGLTALLVASRDGRTGIVQLLLGHKDIDVNQQDKNSRNALWWASYNDHKEVVQLLLEHKDIDVNQQNKDGWCVLYWASYCGHKDIVQILLESKEINVNLPDEAGNTALMWASLKGHHEIVQLFLEHKDIHVNRQNKDGETALMWASREGKKDVVHILEKKMKKK